MSSSGGGRLHGVHNRCSLLVWANPMRKPQRKPIDDSESPQPTQKENISEEMVAVRAREKWEQRGLPALGRRKGLVRGDGRARA